MRDLFFKTTKARHPSKKLRFVYQYLRLNSKPFFFSRPRSSFTLHARLQVLRRMFTWFYTDKFARRHVFKRLLKSHLTSYGHFLSFCTKMETLAPIILYRLNFASHLKESFLFINNGFLLKNGQRIQSPLQHYKLGDFIELCFFKTVFDGIKKTFITKSISNRDDILTSSYFLLSGIKSTNSFLIQSNSYNSYKGFFSIDTVRTEDKLNDIRPVRTVRPLDYYPYYLVYKTQDNFFFKTWVARSYWWSKFKKFGDYLELSNTDTFWLAVENPNYSVNLFWLDPQWFNIPGFVPRIFGDFWLQFPYNRLDQPYDAERFSVDLHKVRD